MRVTKSARLNVRLSPATVAQLDELATVFGNRTAAITIAVDRMYNQERSIMSDDGISEAILARARAIHAEVCGCDNPRCPTRQEVYDWLEDGDQGEGRTTADLVAEWREREAEA